MKIEKNAAGIFVARVITSNGKRTINLRTTNLAEAKEIAAEANIEKAELIAKIGVIKRDVIAQVVLAQRMSMKESLKEWVDWLKLHSSPKHVLNMEQVMRGWIRKMKLEQRAVHEMTALDVDRWINTENTNKASTRELKLSCLRGFFHFCEGRNYCVGNPCREIRVRMDNLLLEQKETKSAQPLTQDLVDIITKAYDAERAELKVLSEKAYAAHELAIKEGTYLPAHLAKRERLRKLIAENLFWRCATQLAWETGLRLGDICQLEWSSIAVAGKLVVWTDKTDTRVELKIKPGLQALLRTAPKTGSPWVFPDMQQLYSDPYKRTALFQAFRRHLKRQGIEGYTFHSLRHSYATRLRARKVPMEHIRQRLGHASVEMTEHYIHDPIHDQHG